MGSFKTAVAMVGQTKITICLVGIVVILAIFPDQANANVKKLKKDVKKLQKKDKEIISQLEDLDNNYDAVTQIVDHIISEGEMVKTLIGELEKKDQELELTMQDIQNKETMFVGHIEEILAYAWFDWKEWSEWSPCSNMGLKTRTRECPGVHCLNDGQGNGMLSNGTEIADCTPGSSTPGPGTSTPGPGTTTTLVPVSNTTVNECDGASSCECSDPSKGFMTYTFMLGEVERCFTVYHPLNQNGALPVMFAPNCYAKDKLSGIEGLNDKSSGNAAAKRYGFARIGLSTPDGFWTFGNDGLVNDDNPMPCSDWDGKDMPYLRTIFNFIDANPSMFDNTKIYAQGFSQNSMFSAYIGFCFNDRVSGIWQGGSGMALTGVRPYLPGCQGQVTASDFLTCNNCNQCINTNFCNECQYWPIYPCYSPVRPMVDCVAEYVNDGISVNQPNPDVESSAIYMYDRLVTEGHDARLLRFSPSADGTIPGSHQNPKNYNFWQVGCLGITEACTTACETSFVACVESKDISTAKKQTEAFADCIEVDKFITLNGCTEDCAPTYGMLAASETPTTKLGGFGAGANTASARPSGSLCLNLVGGL